MSHIEMISADALKALIAQGNVSVIDIRSKDEFDREHIKQACCIPADELSSSSVQGLSEGKVAVFHCQSGVRTRQLQKTIDSLGCEKVFILQGGLTSWKKSKGETCMVT